MCHQIGHLLKPVSFKNWFPTAFHLPTQFLWYIPKNNLESFKNIQTTFWNRIDFFENLPASESSQGCRQKYAAVTDGSTLMAISGDENGFWPGVMLSVHQWNTVFFLDTNMTVVWGPPSWQQCWGIFPLWSVFWWLDCKNEVVFQRKQQNTYFQTLFPCWGVLVSHQ